MERPASSPLGPGESPAFPSVPKPTSAGIGSPACRPAKSRAWLRPADSLEPASISGWRHRPVRHRPRPAQSRRTRPLLGEAASIRRNAGSGLCPSPPPRALRRSIRSPRNGQRRLSCPDSTGVRKSEVCRRGGGRWFPRYREVKQLLPGPLLQPRVPGDTRSAYRR